MLYIPYFSIKRCDLSTLPHQDILLPGFKMKTSMEGNSYEKDLSPLGAAITTKGFFLQEQVLF